MEAKNVFGPKSPNLADIERNYILIVKKNANGYSWKLKKKNTLSQLFSKIIDYARSADNTTKIEGKNLVNVLKIVAGKSGEYSGMKEEHVEVARNLTDQEKFKKVTSAIPELSSKEAAKKSFMEKFARAVDRAKQLGKGLCAMEKHGLEGKTLNEGYTQELVTGYYPEQLDHAKEAYESGDSTLPFINWLEVNRPELSKLQKVAYLKSNQERKNYQIFFSDGVVQTRSSRKVQYETKETQKTQEKVKLVPFDTTHESTEHSGKGTAIFVIGANKQFYAGSHIRGQFHHSSFLGGEAIMGAGELKTNSEGKILEVSNKSGHYKPNLQQNLNTLHLLQNEYGVDLSSVKFIDQVSNFTYNARKFLESKGQCNPEGYTSRGGASNEFQKNAEGIIIGITQTNVNLSGRDKAPELKSAIDEINKKFKEYNIDPLNIEYREKQPSGQEIQYNAADFIDKKGKSLPTGWSGGEFKRDDSNNIIEIIKKETKENEMDDLQESIEVLSKVLGLLEDRGIDTTKIKFSSPQLSEPVSAKEHRDLLNKRRNELRNG